MHRLILLSLLRNSFFHSAGAGIYRHVYLTVANPFHISPFGVYVPATVTGPVSRFSWPPTAAANVTIHTDLEGPVVSGAKVAHVMFDPDGTEVWKGSSAATSTLTNTQVRCCNFRLSI
jgi:hypothetical protein